MKQLMGGFACQGIPARGYVAFVDEVGVGRFVGEQGGGEGGPTWQLLVGHWGWSLHRQHCRR